MSDKTTTNVCGHVRYGADGAGRRHQFFEATAPLAVAQFSRLRSDLVKLAIAPLGSPPLMLLCLVALDLVITKDDLRQVWEALPRIQAWRRRPFVSWQSTAGMWQRRLLSAFSSMAASRMTTTVPFEMVLDETERLLAIAGAVSEGGSGLDAVLTNAAAWSHAFVAPYLAFAVTGQAPMACLPDSVLAREAKGRPLLLGRNELAKAEDSTEGLFEEVPHSSHSLRREEALWMEIDWALSGAEGTKFKRRLAISRRLESLVPRHRDWDGGALLLHWCLHLVRVGTPRTMPVVPETAIEYIRQVVPRLLACSSVLLEKFDDDNAWRTTIEFVLKGVDPGSAGKASAALAAFHAYAVDTLDAPLLKKGILEVEVDRIPRANVLWPVEYDWVCDQLDPSSGDRFLRQLHLLFLLLHETGARSSDLFVLRIDGVWLHPTCVILAIDPRPRDGQIKTTNSRREVVLRNARVIAALRAWLALRASEGAAGKDLLFGCPDGRHTPWRRPESLDVIGRLLKAATGDSTIAPHALRHSAVTHYSVASELSPHGERDYHAFSASKGHGADVSTRRDYDHSFDIVLGREMEALNGVLDLPLATVARWTGATEAAVRKAATRSRSSRQSFAIDRIVAASVELEFPDVMAGFSFSERDRFEFAESAIAGCNGFLQALNVCRDLGDECLLSVAAARHLVSSTFARRVAVGLLDDEPSEEPFRLANQLAQTFSRLPGTDFRCLSQRKYERLLAYVAKPEAKAMILAACRSWGQIRRGTYLSLEDEDAAEGLLQLLSAATITAQQLVVCAESTERSVDAVRLVRSLFKAPPCCLQTTRRSGRPSVYLLFRSADATTSTAAGASVAGLNALMLAATIWRRLLLQTS